MISYETFRQLLPIGQLRQLALTYTVDAANQVRLPATTVFACLLHGLLHHPDLTQRLLEETYFQRSGQHADHSSFGKRLGSIDPKYFRAIYQSLQKRLRPQASEADQKRLHLRFVDATIVSLSAKLLSFGLLQRTTRKGHSLRLVKTVFEQDEAGFPDLLHLCKDASEKSDCVALGDPMIATAQAGDLFVFDAGCHDRHRLLKLHQRGAFWITPHSQQALKIQQALFVSQMPAPLAAPKKGEPTYVLARVESGVFGNGQETPKEQAQWDSMPLLRITGWRWDQRRKVWSLLPLLTNLPLSEDQQHAGPYTFVEVAGLYRERWNIEILFKLLKQHLSFDHLLSRNENGIAVMIYMSLILTWLLLWYQRQTKIDRGWRSVKSWLANDVQSWVQVALAQMRKQPFKPATEGPNLNSS